MINYHGGNVWIVIDKKAFSMSYEIAQKVSMSGAKVEHVLERHEKAKDSTKPWELWKKICVNVQLLTALNQVLW